MARQLSYLGEIPTENSPCRHTKKSAACVSSPICYVSFPVMLHTVSSISFKFRFWRNKPAELHPWTPAPESPQHNEHHVIVKKKKPVCVLIFEIKVF